MLKQEKIDFVNEFSSEFKDKALIYLNYKGVKAPSMGKLRAQIRNQRGLFKVVKNNLLTLMLEKANIEFDKEKFVGMTAVTVCPLEEFGSNGKILYAAEKNAELSIEGGYFEGRKVNADFVKKIASIPSKQELYGQLVGCLAGMIGNLVFTLKAVADEKEKK